MVTPAQVKYNVEKNGFVVMCQGMTIRDPNEYNSALEFMGTAGWQRFVNPAPQAQPQPQEG
jgi:hypothetical protein